MLPSAGERSNHPGYKCSPALGTMALVRPVQKWITAKRVTDIFLGGLALLAVLPLLTLIAVTVWLTLGRPILFVQTRPGRHEMLFQILKFRTMSGRRDGAGRLLQDEQRLGRFGRFLRSTSLDELPELWNVLKGQMSLVGPRPLLVQYLPLYSHRQRRRHEVKPGITGWAQIHGRNALTWEQKFELDVWYVDHRSLWIDLRILAATLRQVIGRRGISRPGHATMPEFMGTREPETRL